MIALFRRGGRGLGCRGADSFRTSNYHAADVPTGKVVDPASYYFRIAAIGIGHRFADRPIYNVFELL
jgi:hypothetical protein